MAVGVDTAAVVVGCGIPYRASVGTALPTITGTLGGSITWTGFTKMSLTENDFEINIETVYDEFKPAGEISELLDNMTVKRISGKIMFSQSDADLLNAVLASSSISSAVVSDGGVTQPTYYALAIQTKLIVYHIKKVIFNIEDAIKLDDEKRTVIPVSFKGRLYTSDSAGTQLYQFHERTA